MNQDKIITGECFGESIIGRESDHFINATELCTRFEKSFDQWQESEHIQQLISRIIKTRDLRKEDLISLSSDGDYYISPGILWALWLTLSPKHETQLLEWHESEQAKEAESKPEIEFTYITSELPDGNSRVSMSFFPMKGIHTQDDLNNVLYNAKKDAEYQEYTLEVDSIWS